MIQQTLRNRLHAAPRRWFGVLVVCWLNLVILPCAMAMPVEEGCPHAPAAVEQASGHHGHHDAGPAHDCTTAASDCCDFVDASLDTRGGKLKNTNGDVAITIVSLPWLADYALTGLTVAPHPPDPVGFSPPLRKLYCVYLN